MKYISKIVEPKKLWLMWQDNTPGRRRHKVGILTKEKFEYLFDELQPAKDAGFDGYPAFPLDNKEYQNALKTFLGRCPPKYRRDYNVYLKAFGLNPDNDEVKNMSDFSLLGYTGAFLHSNPFTLVNDYLDRDDSFDFILQVSRSKDNYFVAYPYDEEAKKYLLDKDIKVEPEDHPEDPNAVKMLVNQEILGYVQRGLTQSFREWIQQKRILEMKITKLNGDASNPNVYAYVEIGKA